MLFEKITGARSRRTLKNLVVHLDFVLKVRRMCYTFLSMGTDWRWPTRLESRRPVLGIDLFWFSEFQFLIFEIRTIVYISRFV